jgi:hypothetical protein
MQKLKLRSNINWNSYSPDRDGAIKNAPWCQGDKKYTRDRKRPHIYGCLPNSELGDKYCVQEPTHCRNKYMNRLTSDKFMRSMLASQKDSNKLAKIHPELFEGRDESQAVPEEESYDDYHSPNDTYHSPNDEYGEDSDGYGTTAYNVAHGLWDGAKLTGRIGLGIGKGLWWAGKQGASAVSYISDKVAEAQEEAERARLVAEVAERKAQLLKEEEERLRNLRRKKNLREGKAKWHKAKEDFLPEEAQYLEYIDNIADASPSYISEEYTDERERADVRDFPKKGPTYGYMPGWDELPSGSIPWNNRHRRYKAPPKRDKRNVDQEFLEHLREATRGLGEETQYKRHRHIRNTPATMDIEEDPKVERVKTTMDIEYEPEINIEKLDDNELDELVEWLESEIKENNTKGFSEEDFKLQKGGKCKKHR